MNKRRIRLAVLFLILAAAACALSAIPFDISSLQQEIEIAFSVFALVAGLAGLYFLARAAWVDFSSG